MSNIDLNSPNLLNIIDIPRQPGAQKEFQIDLKMDEPLGNELEFIENDAIVKMNFTVGCVETGVFLAGSAKSTIKSICAVCLYETNRDVDLNLNEYFPYNSDLITDEDPEQFDNENTYPLIEEHYIDLLQLVRDELADVIEFAPHCKGEHKGEIKNFTVEDENNDNSPFAVLKDLL